MIETRPSSSSEGEVQRLQREVSKIPHVPPKAREAVLRIGLNGATGTLSIDDVRLKASK